MKRSADVSHDAAGKAAEIGDSQAERAHLETEELNLRKLLEHCPDDAASWSALIRVGTRLQRSEGERGYLIGRMHELFPNRPEPYRELGRLWANSDPEKAHEAWAEAHRLDPRHVGGVVRLTRAKIRTGRAEEAAELCAQYLETHPNSLRLARTYATALARLPQDAADDRAHAAWERALELDPENVGSVVQLARIKIRTGRVEEVADLCAPYLKSNPEHLELARAFEEASPSPRSLRHVEHLTLQRLKSHPSDTAVQGDVGNLAINEIRICIQDVSPGGSETNPISVEARPQFMREPAESLAPWRESLIFRELDSLALRDAAKSQQVKPKETGDAQRILFVSHNWNFMRGFVEWFERLDSVQVRTLEPTDLEPACLPPIRQIVGHNVAKNFSGLRDDGYRLPRENYAGQSIKWADVIFVEWCTYPAAWVTWMSETDARIVVRLHSFEAFRHFPHLVNWGRVDTLITVAPQIRNFLNEQIDLARYGVTSVTLPNYNDLRPFDLAKSDRAYKSLGLVGYNNANKNPILALEILNRLVQDDPSWRLILIGHPWATEISSAYENEYHDAFQSFVRTNDLEQYVEVRGFSHDLQDDLVDIDYILSTSAREGTHETVIQGMSSGAIPVVRNWPMVKRWGGSQSLYDSDFVFETVEEAVRSIQDTERTGSRADVQARAKKIAFDTFHSENVMPKYEQALKHFPSA